MTDALDSSNVPSYRTSDWSNRILIAALVGILFLTLYPFRFGFSRHLAGHEPSYLLGGWGKDTGRTDVLLNILLFIPLGFGLAEKLRERGKSRAATLGVALAAGALLSYTVEFLQFYIPVRDSGWEDVITNSTGSVVGFLLFELFGGIVLRILTETERALVAWLTLRRALLFLALYFGLCLAISIPSQKETRLDNWIPDSLLVIGNTASDQFRSSWKGEVYLLEFWDHAVPRDLAQGLTSEELGDTVSRSSLAEYDLSDSPPFQDQRHFLPDLVWVSDPPYLTGLKPFALDGKSWLVSRGPVSAMVNDVRTTQQFALRVRCEPAQVAAVVGRIVSISQVSGPVNVELRQEGADLVFWFRNPLSVKRSSLAWNIPNIFAADQPRDLLFSYDGSDLSLYIDGKKYPRTYQLGPAAGLAQLIRRIRPIELEEYRYFFYALVFFPAGMLLELARRNGAARPIARLLFVVSAVLGPSLLVEATLTYVSGRPMSLENVALSMFLAVCGSLWLNADGSAIHRSISLNQDGLVP